MRASAEGPASLTAYLPGCRMQDTGLIKHKSDRTKREQPRGKVRVLCLWYSRPTVTVASGAQLTCKALSSLSLLRSRPNTSRVRRTPVVGRRPVTANHSHPHIPTWPLLSGSSLAGTNLAASPQADLSDPREDA